MSNRALARIRRRPSRHSTAEAIRRRARDHEHDPTLTDGAAAAERASAGMGTQDAEPTDWLFGGSLTQRQAPPS